MANRTTNENIRRTFRRLKTRNNAFSAKIGKFGGTMGTFRWNASKNGIVFSPTLGQNNRNKYIFQVLNNNRIRWASLRPSAQNVIMGGQTFNWINYRANNNSKNIYLFDPEPAPRNYPNWARAAHAA